MESQHYLQEFYVCGYDVGFSKKAPTKKGKSLLKKGDLKTNSVAIFVF